MHLSGSPAEIHLGYAAVESIASPLDRQFRFNENSYNIRIWMLMDRPRAENVGMLLRCDHQQHFSYPSHKCHSFRKKKKKATGAKNYLINNK